MPTDVNLSKEVMIYQRDQYKNEGLSKKYWVYKDDRMIEMTKKFKRIVDIGCGEGILLEKLTKAFPKKEIFGIDAEMENIEICKKHGLKVTFGSVYDLPLADQSQECVIFCEVIEHLDNTEKALSEINRVLKKDGQLIILFPNDLMFLFSRLAMLKIKEAFYDTGHVKQWTPRSIKEALEKHGFSILKRGNLPFLLWPISLHHLVLAKKN